jgi:hypothetical protein
MSDLDNEGTLLILDGIGVPLYSGRNLTQTLTPIAQATNIRRDVNGTPVNLARDIFQKYASKITCTSTTPPAFDGVWPGQVVIVECSAFLSYPTAGSPSRPVVSGSDVTEGDFVRYRPILVMVVMNDPNSYAEWKSDNQWELDLEEI